jgi:hypothetical protein
MNNNNKGKLTAEKELCGLELLIVSSYQRMLK